MDFSDDTVQEALYAFFRRKSLPLSRSSVDVSELRDWLRQVSSPRAQLLGFRLLGQLADSSVLPFLVESSQNPDPQIARSAARALLRACCRELPPKLESLLDFSLPEQAHWMILVELGEWLDIRFSEPVPLPNHERLLEHLSPYFDWLLEHGSLSRKIQLTMLLCRSGQQKYLSRLSKLLELEIEIPCMDWDDLFWVQTMTPVKEGNRRVPLRAVLIQWLNELDAEHAQALIKPWLHALKTFDSFVSWHHAACNYPEAYLSADLVPVLNYPNPLIRFMGLDMLDRVERAARIPCSLSSSDWFRFVPAQMIDMAAPDQWRMKSILMRRLKDGLFEPDFGGYMLSRPDPWQQILGQHVLARQSQTELLIADEYAIDTLLEQRAIQQKALSRSPEQWLDALCQLDDHVLARQAAESLVALDARAMLPKIWDFLQCSYAEIPPDYDGAIWCWDAVYTIRELGDESWLPIILSYMRSQPLRDDDLAALGEVLMTWAKPVHISLLWEAISASKDPELRDVLLKVLGKLCTRSELPMLISFFDDPHCRWVISQWLETLVEPGDFVALKPYLQPYHPAFQVAVGLMPLMASEAVREHARLLLDNYLFPEHEHMLLCALLW